MKTHLIRPLSLASFPLGAGLLPGLALLSGGWRLILRKQTISQNMLATDAKPPASGQAVNLSSESVAGEEDPGASLDMLAGASSSGSGSGSSSGPVPDSPATLSRGDEAPAGTPGTGGNICRECGGSGRAGEAVCLSCNGSGKVTVGVGGA